MSTGNTNAEAGQGLARRRRRKDAVGGWLGRTVAGGVINDLADRGRDIAEGGMSEGFHNMGSRIREGVSAIAGGSTALRRNIQRTERERAERHRHRQGLDALAPESAPSETPAPPAATPAPGTPAAAALAQSEADQADQERRIREANMGADGRPPLKFPTDGFGRKPVAPPAPGDQADALRAQGEVGQRGMGMMQLADGRVMLQAPGGVRVTLQPGEMDAIQNQVADQLAAEWAASGNDPEQFNRNPRSNPDFAAALQNALRAEVDRRRKTEGEAFERTGVAPEGSFAPSARRRMDADRWNQGLARARVGGQEARQGRLLRGGDYVLSDAAPEVPGHRQFDRRDEQLGHARAHAVRTDPNAAGRNRDAHRAVLADMTGGAAPATADARAAMGLGSRQRVRQVAGDRARTEQSNVAQGLALAHMGSAERIAGLQALGAQRTQTHFDPQTGQLTVVGPDGTPLAQHDLRGGPYARDPQVAGLLAQIEREQARAGSGERPRNVAKLHQQLQARIAEIEAEAAAAAQQGRSTR